MRGLTPEERRVLEECAPGPVDLRNQATNGELEILAVLVARGLVRRDSQFVMMSGNLLEADIYNMTATGKLALELDALVRNTTP